MNPRTSAPQGSLEPKLDRSPSGRHHVQGNVVHLERLSSPFDPSAQPRLTPPPPPPLFPPLPPLPQRADDPPVQPVAAPKTRGQEWSARWERWQIDPARLNKLVVSSYRVAGFAVLTTILLGLASFIFVNLFYLLNHSWMRPMILSSTDPRVLQLNAQYEAEKAARDGVALQRLQLQSQLDDAARVRDSEASFQAAFQDVMHAEALDRGAQLAMMQRLLGDLRRTREEVTRTGREYSAVRKDDLKGEYGAHLIDKDGMTRGGYELSQIASASVGLHEKSVDLTARVAGLQRAVDSLRSGKRSTSYEILHMQHEYEQSVLAAKRAAGSAEALGTGLGMLDKTLAGYDAQLARIEKAPYLRAVDKSVATAFVPYDNLSGAMVGDAVYGCAVSVLWCRRIGNVAEILEGEVVEKHPLHNHELRGVLVRLEVSDPTALRNAVLHLRRPPMAI